MTRDVINRNHPISREQQTSSGSIFDQDINDPQPELTTPPLADSCGARPRPSCDLQSLDSVHLQGMWCGPMRKICVLVCGSVEDEGSGCLYFSVYHTCST